MTNPSLINKRLLYWLLILPISTLLVLELTLQIGSLINKHFAEQRQETNWLTPALRIVTLGDSNTYGLYLKPDESYPKQLEKIWNLKYPTQPIEVINLGYPGSNSSRIVANFEEVLLNFQPDIVTIMIGTNDSWTMPIAAAEATLSQSKEPKIVEWVKSHSRTYRVYNLINRPAFSSDQLQVTTTSDPTQAETAKTKPASIEYKSMLLDFSMALRKPQDNFDPDQNMLHNLEKLIHFSTRTKQRIVFLTYPANKNYYKQANKIIKQSMKEHKFIDFIDVTEAFIEVQPPKGEGNDYFFPDLHATQKGNEVVALKISEDLHALLNNQSNTEK